MKDCTTERVNEARAVECVLEYIPQGFELESSKVLLTTCESTRSFV